MQSGFVRQSLNRRQLRVVARAHNPCVNPLLDIHRACEQIIAHAFGNRHALACEQGLRAGSLSFDEFGIVRHDFARSDKNHVADFEFIRRNQLRIFLRGIILHTLGEQTLVLQHIVQIQTRFGQGAVLDVTHREQQGDKHRHRIKIQMSASREHRIGTGDKRHGNRKRHGRVHADLAQSPLGPCTAKNRLGAVQHRRQCEKQIRPTHQHVGAHVHVRVRKIIRIHKHHRLHHQEQRDQHAKKLTPLVFFLRLAHLVGRLRIGVVAEFLDARNHSVHADFCGVNL